MKQQTVILQKKKLLKPSELLELAHKQGVKKIQDKWYDGQGGFCARGWMNENVGYDYDYILHCLYGEKHQATKGEAINVLNILSGLVKLNDSSPEVTFQDCANYMRSFGL